MKIIDMVNGKFSGVSAPPPQKAANTAFDTFLAEAGRNLGQMDEGLNQGRTRDDAPRSRRNEDSRREGQHMRRREAPQPTEDATATAGTAVVQEQQNATEPTDSYDAAVDEAEVTEKVAEVMQVPVEEVMEWLDEADLRPNGLNEPQAVAKMLQYALDAESAAELLTDEKFPSAYKAVNEAMAAIVAEAKTKAGAKLTEETVNKLAEVVEDAEVTTEDGEVVVTTSLRREANDNQQAATSEESVTDAEVKDVNVFTEEEAMVNETQIQGPAMNIEAAATRAETVARAAAPPPVNTSNVIEQIMNQVKVQTSGGQFTEMRLTLRPESLGDIILRVVTQNGIVMAQFEAENQRVKEALEANMNQLRNALEEAGIKFSELSVSVGQDENERMNQFNKARQESRHRADSIEDAADDQPEVSLHNGVIDVTA